jgi:DNA-binding NtrC family response regulator
MTWPVIPGLGTVTGGRGNSPKDGRREVPRGRSIRMLIVDDEPSICKALGMAFGHAGYEVFTAKSGEAAIATVQSQRLDVLLIDLRIPDVRGDEIFEYAAGFQPPLRDHTLFMTGDISDQAIELIAACRCNFIRKPFDLTLMLDTVAALSPLEHVRKSSA